MSTGLILVGVSLAIAGYAGRYITRRLPGAIGKMNEAVKSFPGLDLNSKYYKGGFDSTMNKREACLILGVSSTASKLKIKEAHKKIMLLNHPDRGGSPYIAAKINEAKDFMDKQRGLKF